MAHFQFKAKTGCEPVYDALARVNCPRAGEGGHWQCGWCEKHDKPRFQCGSDCLLRVEE